MNKNMNTKLLDELEKVLKEKNIWKLKITRDDPVIVVEGSRNGLIWITKDILDWDNFRTKQELNQFEIAMDLEDLYISFFLKPNNHS
jgi:hypothetical protein